MKFGNSKMIRAKFVESCQIIGDSLQQSDGNVWKITCGGQHSPASDLKMKERDDSVISFYSVLGHCVSDGDLLCSTGRRHEQLQESKQEGEKQRNRENE